MHIESFKKDEKSASPIHKSVDDKEEIIYESLKSISQKIKDVTILNSPSKLLNEPKNLEIPLKKIKIKQIASLPTSVYHSIRHNDSVFVAGSGWNRKQIKKPKGFCSATGVLYRVNEKEVESFSMDTDMLYIVESISPELLFLGAKKGKNAFQLFSTITEKVVKQNSDLRGDGCYGTLYLPTSKELLMNTRNGYLQTVDINTLEIKESRKITSQDERLWQIHYEEKDEMIYTSDYLGNLYKIEKKGFNIIKKVSLFDDIYKHNDNHDNPPSLWGLSFYDDIIVGGDRFGGITIWDNNLNLISHNRLKKNGEIINDPNLQFPSSDMESIMSVKMIDNEHFLFGSRWGNVFLSNLDGEIKKIIDVPMGIQKENSAFTMEQFQTSLGNETLITFGDGQVYSVLYEN